MLSLRPFKTRHAGLADLLNWAMLVDPGVVLCKDGSLLAGWLYRGPDLASSTDEERNWVSERINAGLSRLRGGWASWTVAARIPAADYPPADASHFPDPVSQMIEQKRRQQFMSVGRHFETQYAMVMQYTPPLRSGSRIVDLVYDDDGTDASPADRILDLFRQTLSDVEDAIGDAVRLRRMRRYSDHPRHLGDELIDFLAFTVTGEVVKLNVPPGGAYLDTILAAREFWPGHTPRLGSETDGSYIACVAIEGFPHSSTPNMLNALDDLALPYRWSSRMIYLDQHETVEELKKYRRVWKHKERGWWANLFKLQTGPINQDAVEAVSEVDAALKNANSGLVSFGYYTPVVSVMAPRRSDAIEAARAIATEIQGSGFLTRIETENATEAWLGSLPGHVAPNVRRPPVHTQNLADLLPLTSVWTGRETNPCPLYPPGSPPLMHAATTGATPFRLNLHVDDVGHSLMFGPTGAGKSTLLCTIAREARRYQHATVAAFDKGRSMLATALACGGRHYDIASDRALSFCPLEDLGTDADVAWAEEWACVCYELQAGKPRTPGQRDAIYRALQLLRAPESERTLTHFVAQIQDEEVRVALRYYTLAGPAGRILDAETDGIVESSFACFEIGELMQMGERMLIPTLLHLFRRVEKSLHGQPAFLLLDEAWVMLMHPVFREKIREWLKTMRKANCAVILATQSLSDAMRSGMIDVLVESCPTKIFLPNEEAGKKGVREFYEALGLNDAQIEIIRTATKKRHYYVESPEGRRLIDLGLGPLELAFAGISDPEQIARLRRTVDAHGTGWPYAWLQEKGVSVT